MTDHEHDEDSLDARGRIEEALDGLLDRETLNVLLKEVLAVTKQARGWCPTCKKAVQVDIPDSKAVVSAMSELLVQAKGKPAQENPDDDHVTVIYTTVLNLSNETLTKHADGTYELPDGTLLQNAC